jgi:hypothetical protein
VAIRINGDQAAFWGCGFFGAQDTLHDDRGRHYFKECFIQGSIDFIFGDARSLYEVSEEIIKKGLQNNVLKLPTALLPFCSPELQIDIYCRPSAFRAKINYWFSHCTCPGIRR